MRDWASGRRERSARTTLQELVRRRVVNARPIPGGEGVLDFTASGAGDDGCFAGDYEWSFGWHFGGARGQK